MPLIIMRPTGLDPWLRKQNTTQEISDAICQTLGAIQAAFQSSNHVQTVSEKLNAFGFIKKKFEKKSFIPLMLMREKARTAWCLKSYLLARILF